MKPRHKRLTFILIGLVTLGVAAALILNALRSNLTFFFSPSVFVLGFVPEAVSFFLFYSDWAGHPRGRGGPDPERIAQQSHLFLQSLRARLGHSARRARVSAGRAGGRGQRQTRGRRPHRALRGDGPPQERKKHQKRQPTKSLQRGPRYRCLGQGTE